MFSSFYLNRIVYYSGFFAAVLFAVSYFFSFFFTLAVLLVLFIIIAIISDATLLYAKKNAVSANRILPERLSNGDENKISIELQNRYGFKIKGYLIDELPFQFQNRDWQLKIELEAHQRRELLYTVTPHQRGEYHFGNINVFIASPLRIVSRRYSFKQEETVKVYPSFIQMRRYQLLATSNKLAEAGTKRLRKLGHSLEFEQIKEYVRGDDHRTINWKATARRGDLMVNNFTDERSQQIYCIINKGRVMKMPFEGITLLDYAINAALILANVALLKGDRAGLITFSQNLDAFLPADKKGAQLNLILESLYKQQTHFLESDFEKLFSVIRNRITQRSLLILFTNFESLESLERELPSLKRIAHYHLLMVVFFENTELSQLADGKAKTTEDIYIKIIAEKYRHEKRLMVKELAKNGILSLLTTPQRLTVTAINKYIALKKEQSI